MVWCPKGPSMSTELTALLIQKVDEVLDQLGDLKEDVGNLTGVVGSLAGNGQPGRVGKLEHLVAVLIEQVHFWRGAIWIIGGIVTALGGAEVWHFVTRTVK